MAAEIAMSGGRNGYRGNDRQTFFARRIGNTPPLVSSANRASTSDLASPILASAIRTQIAALQPGMMFIPVAR
jgi:hypothetical protein